MIKIGIVPSHPFHHSLGTDVRLINLVSSLSKLDTEIHFITPFRADALPRGGKIHVHAQTGLSSNSRFNERIYRTTKMLFNRPFWSRNLVCNSFMLDRMAENIATKIHKLVQNLHLDVVLGELEIAAMACIKLRESLKAPIIADIHGTWAEETIASGIVRENSRQANALRKFESEIFHGSDAVIAVSEEARKFFKEFYNVPEDKTTVVPGGAIPRISKAKKVGTPTKVVFSGMITYRENVELLIRSMPLILKEYPSAKFYLTRKGDKAREIMNLAAQMHLTPEFFYYPSQEDFFNFLKDTHIGVLTSTSDIPRKIAYPAKLFDYMSVGLPIVSNDVGGWVRIIKENRLGIVTGNTPEEFAEAILKLLKDPDLIYGCGQRGLELIKTRFNYDISAKILYNLCETLKANSKTRIQTTQLTAGQPS
jgi:glycosyltransferase involved in cell wall biosynthesis